MGRPKLESYVTGCDSIDLEQFEKDNDEYIDHLLEIISDLELQLKSTGSNLDQALEEVKDQDNRLKQQNHILKRETNG